MAFASSSKTQGTLDTFISSRSHPADPIFISKEIHDRGSIFVANIYHATTPQQARARVEHIKRVVHSGKPATHEISAWRCMVLKQGRSGLGGPDDFELQAGSKDDGESWAGAKVLGVMERSGILDAVVIVSRWWGGTMLGPARFSHIEDCALEVCREFRQREELAELRTLLETLDGLLADLREQHQKLNSEAPVPSPSLSASLPKPTRKMHDYSTLDTAKAKRLVRARENAINVMKTLIAKFQDS